MGRSSFISRLHPVRLCLIAAAAVALPLLVSRFRREARIAARAGDVPRTPEQIAGAAQARGLQIPSACRDGVAANLALLAGHAERMRGVPTAGTA